MTTPDPLLFEVGGGYTARHLCNMLEKTLLNPDPSDVLAAALLELRDLRAAAAPKTQPSAALVALRAVEYARAEFAREHADSPYGRAQPVTAGDFDTFLSDMLKVLSDHIQEG